MRRTRGELELTGSAPTTSSPAPTEVVAVDGRPGRLGRADAARRARRPRPSTALDAAGARARRARGERRRRRWSSRCSSTSYPPRWPRAWSSTTWCSSSRPAIVAGEADRVTGLRRLYVCLTRAVTSLAVCTPDRCPTSSAPRRLSCQTRSHARPRPVLAARRRRPRAAWRGVRRPRPRLPRPAPPDRGARARRRAAAARRHRPRPRCSSRRGSTTPSTRARDDEERRSANLAESARSTARWPARSARLVRLTATHRPADDDLAGQVLCDADLAILAAHGRALRVVRRRRARGARPRPRRRLRRGSRRGAARPARQADAVPHPAARRRWEQAARANVERELSTLEG